jgi:hypothetical protein
VTRRLPRLDARLQIVDNQGRPTRQYQMLIDKQDTLIEQALDANDALDATQTAALDALNDTTIKANAAYEHIGPGEYAFTASATLPDDCRTAVVDCTAGAVTLTLLPVADCLDNIFCVKTDGTANAMTVDGDGAELISGAANKSTTTQWATIKVRPAPTFGQWIQI